MKLLELIVSKVKREDIPESANFFVQDWNKGSDVAISFTRKPNNSESELEWKGIGYLIGGLIRIGELSEDAATTIITREELMRAYDLVEQGYTLWFGGDCPVAPGVKVEAVTNCGTKTTDFGNFWDWNVNNIGTYIIAYKVADIKSDEKPAIIETYNPSSTILCDLMRDISTSMPEMMAADMVELADYLIAQGWGKHE